MTKKHSYEWWRDEAYKAQAELTESRTQLVAKDEYVRNMSSLLFKAREELAEARAQIAARDGASDVEAKIRVEQGDCIRELKTQIAAKDAVIDAIYQWIDRVDAVGGTTTISGIAKCHAMMKSLRNNRQRIAALAAPAKEPAT